jgi:hypothetical protein
MNNIFMELKREDISNGQAFSNRYITGPKDDNFSKNTPNLRSIFFEHEIVIYNKILKSSFIVLLI